MRFLAYADAAYGAVDLLVFAGDRLEFDITGTSSIPQDLHQLWDGAGLVIGAASVAGLVTYGANGLLKFSLTKTKSAYKELLRRYAGNENQIQISVEQLIQKLKETRNTMKATWETSQDGQRMLKHINAEIAALEKTAKLKVTANLDDVSITVSRDNYSASIHHAGQEFPVGTMVANGVDPDDLTHLSINSDRWTTSPIGQEIGELKNIRFIEDGNPRRGTLKLDFDFNLGLKFRIINLVEESATNLRTINFAENLPLHRTDSDPLAFWNRTDNPNFQHLDDGQIYIKYDPDEMKMLVASYDGTNGSILGFYEGTNAANAIGRHGIDGLLPIVKRIHGVCDGCNTITINGITLNPTVGKNTLVLGQGDDFAA
ncbi:MAG: BSD domain-containing protein, partial [Bacteroidota bacterium]